LGFNLNNNQWLYIPYLLGSFAFAIASYAVLKKNGVVTGFKEWMKNIRAVRGV